MPGEPGVGASLLRTAVVLGVLTAAVGCGNGDDTPSEIDASPAAAGTATLFPGSGDERGPDIDFPPVAVGESAAVDVKVRNNSGEPMTVKKVTAKNAKVSKDNCTGRTMPSGGECEFSMLLQSKTKAQQLAGSVTLETDKGTTSSSVAGRVVEKGKREGPTHAPTTPEGATGTPSVEPPEPTVTDTPEETPPTTTVSPERSPLGTTAGPEELLSGTPGAP
ncbi:hypothetical protein ACOBQB_03375 [Streptomyces sp. G5(2025)]|uniref:hypothetical protein n=1 Tax=Streptomyces sp. G5(2025) TaxID=3406628 RepID=UPI003C240253